MWEQDRATEADGFFQAFADFNEDLGALGRGIDHCNQLAKLPASIRDAFHRGEL